MACLPDREEVRSRSPLDELLDQAIARAGNDARLLRWLRALRGERVESRERQKRIREVA
jgi:hypothetical protein